MHHLALHDDAKSLLSQWFDLRSEGEVPDRRFLDPVRLRHWIGMISVVHLHEGEYRLYMALHGAHAARYHGPDVSKQYLDEVTPALVRESTLAAYDMCMETLMPCYSRQTLTLGNVAHKHMERMVLPCSTDDLTRPDRFIVWVAPVRDDSGEESSLFLPFSQYETGAAGYAVPEMKVEMFSLCRDAL